MNVHVPQTEEARAEAAILLSVANNLCVPKSGELIIAAIQDFLTASYLITKKDTFYDRASFAQSISTAHSSSFFLKSIQTCCCL
jgi:DNA-directed RNA polymerase III subunit RPC1